MGVGAGGFGLGSSVSGHAVFLQLMLKSHHLKGICKVRCPHGSGHCASLQGSSFPGFLRKCGNKKQHLKAMLGDFQLYSGAYAHNSIASQTETPRTGDSVLWLFHEGCREEPIRLRLRRMCSKLMTCQNLTYPPSLV